MSKNGLVINILEYIDNNIYKKITLDELSRLFYFNKDYVMRVFKKEIGLTIVEYINQKRVYASLEKLKTTDDLILKIAINHGFISQEYYSEIFNKYLGVSPKTYRKFTRVNANISNEELETIRTNLVDLKYQLDEIERYKKNTTPQKTTKKLSLYK